MHTGERLPGPWGASTGFAFNFVSLLIHILPQADIHEINESMQTVLLKTSEDLTPDSANLVSDPLWPRCRARLRCLEGPSVVTLRPRGLRDPMG